MVLGCYKFYYIDFKIEESIFKGNAKKEKKKKKRKEKKGIYYVMCGCP